MFESLQAAFAANQLVSGGVVLATLGVAAMWLREVPGKFAKWAKHFLVTTLTVDSREELLFPALVEYMDTREALRRLATRLTVEPHAERHQLGTHEIRLTAYFPHGLIRCCRAISSAARRVAA